MRVSHVIAPVSFGGGESLLLSLLKEKRSDLDESIILLYRAPVFEKHLHAAGVPVSIVRNREIGHGLKKWEMGLDTIWSLFFVGKLRKLLREQDPDLVHVHGFPGSLLYALARFSRRARSIYTHHSFRGKTSFPEREILGRVYASYGAVTGVSGVASDSMEKAFPVLSGKVRTIYNCVHDRFFEAQTDAEWKGELPVGRSLYIQIARFAPGKNQMLVVNAVNDLSDEWKSKIAVVFAGDGAERAAVEKRVKELQLEENFLFAGHVEPEALPGLMANCGYGLLPSDNEGFGIGAAECMAVGLPVLSLDTEVMREVVGGGGIQCRRESLSGGLVEILESGEQRRKAAREQADRYRCSRIKPAYYQLYQDVIE